MKSNSGGALLSTVFVDYDNIYLSLKRKSEEAAKRFAKDAPLWIGELMSGRLITPTNGPSLDVPRRIVMNRCYGNPVPRRNSSDNSTDMNSFPFVRHHFLRAGFEVVDCPPLTAQLKNSSDIRMVMDVRDYLNHDTYFDEFVILSGDADFTPLLHRLRAHARRTVIFANDYTAAPYTAISDGEVRESDLIQLLLDGKMLTAEEANNAASARPELPSPADLEETRRVILKEVADAVRSAGQPVPLEALADRAVLNIGHERTVGTAWGGSGTFRDLLAKGLTGDLQMSDQAPYFVFDASRRIAVEAPARAALPPAAARTEPRVEARVENPQPVRDERIEPHFDVRPAPEPQRASEPLAARNSAAAEYAAARMGQPLAAREPQQHQPQQRPLPEAPAAQSAPPAPQPGPAAFGQQPPPPRAPAPPPPRANAPAAPAPRGAQENGATTIQRSIARIHDACQAPPLSPPEYRALFDVMAEEITRNGFNGTSTLNAIAQRAGEIGIDMRRDDVRFVLDVVSEQDPWFEQGASQRLFAGRFRNFVVARCRSQGLSLSAEELDLIDAWFAGGATQPAAQRPAQRAQATGSGDSYAPAGEQPGWTNAAADMGHGGGQGRADTRFAADDMGGDELPRIVRRGR
ncbi:MAG: NYN domain-containing protein [Hyphomicrobiaceae bacterium]